MKGILERGTDRITDHLADTTPADQAGDGKQGRDQKSSAVFAGFLFKEFMDIVSRTAPVAAIERIWGFVFLGKRCFYISS